MLHNGAFNKNMFDMKQLKHSQIITQNLTHNNAQMLHNCIEN